MIKKNIVLGSFVFLFVAISFAQESVKVNGYLKFGTGIYLDISKLGFVDNFTNSYTGLKPKAVVIGQPLWIEGAVKLNNGIFVSADLMYVTLNRKYLDILFKGQKNQYVIKNYTFSLGYEFNIGKHQKFMPQLGLLYYRNKSSLVETNFEIDNGVIVSTFLNIDSSVNEEIGTALNLDYYYQFKNSIFLGLRTNIIYVVGFEGITFTPILGVKF